MLLFRLALARSSSACQTSLLARLSGKIHSLPGRAKRGKAVTTPEQLLFRFALARSNSACQIKRRLPDLVACQTFRVNPIPPRPSKARQSGHDTLAVAFQDVCTMYVLRTYYVRTTYVL